MRKNIIIFSLFLYIFINIGFGKAFVVGVYDNPPLVYFENNKAKGVFVDILNEIALSENWNIIYKYGTFSDLIEKLKEGNIDMMLDVAYSKERAKFFYYNKEPVFTNWGMVYTRYKNVKSLLDFEDKKIAVIKNDIYYVGKEGIKNILNNLHIKASFIEVSSYDECLKYVYEKKADIAIISRSYNGNNYGLKKTPIIFSPVDVYIVFSHSINENIINTIDAYLQKWKNQNNSIYYMIINKYFFNETIHFPRWFFITIGVILLLLLIVLTLLYIYRKLLIRATFDLNLKNKQLEEINEELLSMSEELEDLYNKNNEFSNNLFRMTEVLSHMTPGNSLEDFYKEVLELVIEIVPEADYGSIVLIDVEKKTTKFIASYGHSFEDLKKIKSLIGKIPKRENTRIVKDVLDEERNKELNEKDYKTLKNAVKPIKETLIREIQLNPNIWIKIAVDIAKNSKKNFSENSVKLIEGFGNLIKAFWLEKLSVQEVKNAYLNFATKLAIIAEAHDDITGAHIYRVGKISGFIAKKMGLNEEKVKEIETFAPLHDIGKIFINRDLLTKSDELTEEEFDLIKQHTIFSLKLLNDPYFITAKNIALYHHERYDGSGYPFGLSGDEIPIEAQIVALADVYDALRSVRTYKIAFSHEEVVKIITEGDGRTKPEHFHPEILSLFKKYHNEIRKIYDEITKSHS
ncbi:MULTISPECIES: HD domain-containing phosphohydrolase [unclassified Marinitoga]|uniref:HD domain-containing phosphohydrolase n=1 Tax=unclassified Marinitoga TaxID=2640159 RepID=UPI0015861ACD|nr:MULTISPECIES: HD domain-containing phosphohydrolase [unclassified Marinitoga]